MNDNLYYSPEAFDLTLIAEFDGSSGDYEFNIFAVWQHKLTGQIYYGNDAGCSCPAPFEFKDISGLSTANNFHGLRKAFQTWVRGTTYGRKDHAGRTEFIEKLTRIKFSDLIVQDGTKGLIEG